MSLSNTISSQREKEAKALKFSIIYSLIFSLIINTGVLALLGNFFYQFSQLKVKPRKLIIVEALSEDEKLSPKINPGGGGGSFGSGSGTPGGGKSNFNQDNNLGTGISYLEFIPSPPQLETLLDPGVKELQNSTPATESPVKVNNPEIQQPISIKKVVNDLNTSLTKKSPQEIVLSETGKKISEFSKSLHKNPSSQTPTTQTQSSNIGNSSSSYSESTRGLLDNLRNFVNNRFGKSPGIGLGKSPGIGLGKSPGIGVGNGPGIGVGNGSGIGVGNGPGIGVGNSPGIGVGNEVEKTSKKEETPKSEKEQMIATKPNSPTINTFNPSQLDPSDCQKCILKRPKSAIRKGIEGDPQVAIDYDKNGRVTNIKLTRSSGHKELDEAMLEQVKDFELKKPISGGRKEVLVSGGYYSPNSSGGRQFQQRKREREKEIEQGRREIAQNKPEKTASASEQKESSRDNQQGKTPHIKDNTSENTTKHQQETTTSTSRRRQRTESEQPNRSEKTPRRQRTESEQPTRSEKNPRRQRTESEQPTRSEKTPRRQRTESEQPTRSEKTPRRQRTESEQPTRSEKTPRRQRTESEQPTQSRQNKSEAIEKRRKRLEEILLRHRQKTISSPAQSSKKSE